MSRFFEVVPASGGKHNRHFCIRDGERRLLCVDMGLSWDQADRLRDILEAVHARATRRDLRLPDPPPETRAA